MPGAFVPQCDINGEYKPQQCHGSSGYCWCADLQGNKIIEPFQPWLKKDVDCREERCNHAKNTGLTACMLEYLKAPAIPGAFAPSCDERGHYKSEQCHGSSGYCWCVDLFGQKISPEYRPWEVKEGEKISCDNQRFAHADSMTTCQRERVDSYEGCFKPTCDSEGEYSAVQCFGEDNCWCVDSEGKPLDESRKYTIEDWPKEICEGLRAGGKQTKCQKIAASRNPNVRGTFIPQCDAKGEFLPEQCHQQPHFCWCVDSEGEKITGLYRPSMMPDCLAERAKRVEHTGAIKVEIEVSQKNVAKDAE